MSDYTREQLRTLYLKLPLELRDWIAADETNEIIDQILEKYGLTNEKISLISLLIRNVLFGLLSPNDFDGILEKEADLDLDYDSAKKISHEINRFIFFPVKEALAELYHPITTATAAPIVPETEKESAPIIEETAEMPNKVINKDDSYREKIE